MLNPIEFGFSKIKACVRRRLAEGYNGGFVDLIQESTRKLSESDSRGVLQSYCAKLCKSSRFVGF